MFHNKILSYLIYLVRCTDGDILIRDGDGQPVTVSEQQIIGLDFLRGKPRPCTGVERVDVHFPYDDGVLQESRIMKFIPEG